MLLDGAEKDRVIEQIEKFATEFQRLRLGELEPLAEREVELDQIVAA